MISNNKNLIERLTESSIYKEYETAFSETTGLPMKLQPIESWQLPHHNQKKENPMCELMAQKSRSCSLCLQVQQEITENAKDDSYTAQCAIGLSDTAIPVKLGDEVIGFLHTGQVFRKPPVKSRFSKTVKLMEECGIEFDKDDLKKMFDNTKVLSGKQHDSMVKLLAIFADHLSMVTNQIMVQDQNSESPMIKKAVQYIQDHYADDLSLEQVAKAANMSSFYFCKMFKKEIGLNFTDYVSRIRIEKAKNLLLNPNLRISEIAYEVGFQSLTHFNRVFKKVVGCSPTHYRAKLPESRRYFKQAA